MAFVVETVGVDHVNRNFGDPFCGLHENPKFGTEALFRVFYKENYENIFI